jgi:hypothetical protein
MSSCIPFLCPASSEIGMSRGALGRWRSWVVQVLKSWRQPTSVDSIKSHKRVRKSANSSLLSRESFALSCKHFPVPRNQSPFSLTGVAVGRPSQSASVPRRSAAGARSMPGLLRPQEVVKRLAQSQALCYFCSSLGRHPHKIGTRVLAPAGDLLGGLALTTLDVRVTSATRLKVRSFWF